MLGLWLSLVVAAYFAGQFFWGSMKPAPAQQKAQRAYSPSITTIKKNQSPKRVVRKQSSEVNTIQAANLFGNSARVNKPTNTKKNIEAPETSLKFELQGIFINTNAAQSRALIAEKGKPANSYKREDQLPGNVVLDEIFANRVLLRRAGRLETLSFPKKRNKGSSNKRGDILTYHPKNTATDVVARSKDAYYKDPAKAFRNYGLVMDENADGLRLEGGARSKLLESVGLKKGDLIRSVNGKTLSDFLGDTGLVDSVVESGELSVEIERNGQPIVLSLPIP